MCFYLQLSLILRVINFLLTINLQSAFLLALGEEREREREKRKCRTDSFSSSRQGKSINGFTVLMARDTLHTSVNENWKREVAVLEWRTAYYRTRLPMGERPAFSSLRRMTEHLDRTSLLTQRVHDTTTCKFFFCIFPEIFPCQQKHGTIRTFEFQRARV